MASHVESFLKSDEEYITLQVSCLKIMDTYRFLPGKLSKHGENLNPEDCHILRSRGFLETPKSKAMKGIYPYDYIKTETDFSEIDEIMSQTSLPPQSSFFSKLNNQALLHTDYLTAKSNWDTWRCANMYDYSIKYLEIDVLILADVFECFRKNCLENYKIDPCYRVSLPSLTWQAGMHFTGVKLKYYKQDTKDIYDLNQAWYTW